MSHSDQHSPLSHGDLLTVSLHLKIVSMRSAGPKTLLKNGQSVYIC